MLLRRVTTNTRCQSIDHRLRQLTRLINKPAGQLQRQQLPHVTRLIQRKKNNFAVQPRRAITLRQLDVMRDRRGPTHLTPSVLRKYLLPRLDRRGPQFRVAITNNGKPRVTNVIDRRWRLLHSAQHHLRQTRIGLARANRTHQAANKAVVVEKIPRCRTLREVQVQPSERVFALLAATARRTIRGTL